MHRTRKTAARRIMGWALTSVMAVPMTLLTLAAATAPVSAECTGPMTPMPRFTDVAPTAERIVIGTVVGEIGPPGEGLVEQEGDKSATPGFRLRVDDVLRGTAPATLDVRALRTRMPRSGTCPDTPLVYATPGDVIAIAYLGMTPGVDHRVTSAAWISGTPNRQLVPHAERLTLAKVERASQGLPPTNTSSVSAPVADPRGLVQVLVAIAGAAAAGLWFLACSRPSRVSDRSR